MGLRSFFLKKDMWDLSEHSLQAKSCKDITRTGASPGTWPCWHPDGGLAASRTVRNKCWLFKPPDLWYSVRVANTDCDTTHCYLHIKWERVRLAGERSAACLTAPRKEGASLSWGRQVRNTQPHLSHIMIVRTESFTMLSGAGGKRLQYLGIWNVI